MAVESCTNPQECSWEVDDLRFSGLTWGPKDGIPVLMLHGWMDHAGSFQELAPLLTGCHVVALDLSGQGLSGHRSAHASYNIWDDLPQIVGVLDQLGWEKCVLMGHSRGANIAALFAAAQPERVRALVSLDSLIAEPTKDSIVTTLRAFIEQTQSQKSRAPRIFPTKMDYIARRAAQGNSHQTSEALADRALEKGQDGFRMRGDARLFASSAVKLTREDVEAVLKAIRCPVLNIWAENGIQSRRPQVAELVRLGEQYINEFERVELGGDHHFHLDPDIASEIATLVLRFLAKRGIR